jgi:hypothetical protein
MSVAVIDTHASGAQVLHVAGHRPARFSRAIASVADLAHIGELLHHSDAVTQIWLTPRWQADRAIADLEHAWTPLRFAGAAPAAIVAPALNRRLGVQLADVDGAELCAALELIRTSLAVGLEGSPGQTAEMLLRGLLHKRGEFAPLDPLFDLPAVNEPVLSWIRPISEQESRRPWLLAIDRRGAYLQSMVLAEVGLGDPFHVSSTVLGKPRADGLPFWRDLVWRPGYYRARLDPWRVEVLPDPLRAGRSGDSFWLTAPTLRLGAGLGLVAAVDEAWIWERRSRVLRPIGERITHARQTVARMAPELVPIADPLLKRMYTELVGRLRMDAHRGTPLYRPDWHATIVADARARIWQAAATSYHQYDLTPAACNLDCWYLLADRAELPAGFDPKFWRLETALAAAEVGLDVFDGQSVRELSARVAAVKRGRA